MDALADRRQLLVHCLAEAPGPCVERAFAAGANPFTATEGRRNCESFHRLTRHLHTGLSLRSPKLVLCATRPAKGAARPVRWETHPLIIPSRTHTLTNVIWSDASSTGVCQPLPASPCLPALACQPLPASPCLPALSCRPCRRQTRSIALYRNLTLARLGACDASTP